MVNFSKTVLLVMAMALSSLVAAEGKIAVLSVQDAILNSDAAQSRLNGLRQQADYVENKKEFDNLRKEQQELFQKLQKDAAVMSPEQQAEQRKKLTEMRADYEHVGRKLQNAEQELAQALMQEMAPQVQQIVTELIKTEGIGLLLNRQSAMHVDSSFSITAKVTDKLNQSK